jgi:hypothetical protein
MPALASAEDAGRLGNLVLARIACARSGVEKGVIAADLAPLAGPQMSAAGWRGAVNRAIDDLAAADLIIARPGGLVATPAGAGAAASFLGAPARSALTWDRACGLWLIAKALGLRRTTARRLAALATADGLRAAILVHAYALSFKGEATPARLRHALAGVALKRAFCGQGATGLADKLGLSARASRLLAAQLLDKPRDPGTDRRLVAALAAQACGGAGAGLGDLRVAVLRRGFAVSVEHADTHDAGGVKRGARHSVPSPLVGEAQGGGDCRTSQVGSPPAPSPSLQGGGQPGRVRDEVGGQSPTAAAGAATASQTHRPLDLPGFASEVRRCAAGEAQGWSGDRKAYISSVWRSLRQRRPEWTLSEIEFKGMLAEAHRAGQLALANADLKDESNIKDVQESALIYKNAVFHFIRVDA